MSTTQTMNTSQSSSTKSPCRCHEQPPAAACCCGLVCFDRPNYFCGHLLTDADLSLQQKYVMEKNKLYHRTIDGYGVVCGLKLTCDCHCQGHILIHEGFAIDDCGNDLVVCETARFDVITALKNKKLLIADPPQDECEPKHRKSRCEIKQCFYITICYDEEVSDYETPFQSSCTSGPKECLPTRTHERVRFDITDKLPPRHSYLPDLEKRMRECFEIHCEGPIGRIMKEHVKQLQYIIGEGKGERPERWRDPCELFCTLRAYFLNHLKVKPDEFNCGLYDEVACLTCPRECREEEEEEEEEHREYRQAERGEGRADKPRDRREKQREQLEEERERREEEECEERYRCELREAFRKLLYCMERHQFDCVFGDLIFDCPEPCEAHCLVLGTVEVVDGKLVRVCNTPRDYRWTPANLVQILTYSVMAEWLTGEGREGEKTHCCPDYHKFEPTTFLREFELSECGRYYAAKSWIDSFQAFVRSLHHSFDFTDSAAFAPAVFANLRADEVEMVKERFGISVVQREAAEFNAPTPMQALQGHALLRRDDSLLAYKSGGETSQVLHDFVKEISPDRRIGGGIETALHQIKELADEVKRLREIVDKIPPIEEAKKAPKKPTKEEPGDKQ